jgi:hypothetical protein
MVCRKQYGSRVMRLVEELAHVYALSHSHLPRAELEASRYAMLLVEEAG